MDHYKVLHVGIPLCFGLFPYYFFDQLLDLPENSLSEPCDVTKDWRCCHHYYRHSHSFCHSYSFWFGFLFPSGLGLGQYRQRTMLPFRHGGGVCQWRWEWEMNWWSKVGAVSSISAKFSVQWYAITMPNLESFSWYLVVIVEWSWLLRRRLRFMGNQPPSLGNCNLVSFYFGRKNNSMHNWSSGWYQKPLW